MSIAFQASAPLCNFFTGNNTSLAISTHPRFIRTTQPKNASHSLLIHRQKTPSCVAAPSPPQPAPSLLPIEPTNIPDVITAPTQVTPKENTEVKFTSRKTIVATVLAFVAGCGRVLMESPTAFNSTMLPRAGMGFLAVVAGRAFTSGIVKPMDSKQLSNGTKLGIRTLSATAGIGAAWMLFPQFVFGLFAFGMCIGAVDSVPPTMPSNRFATPLAVAVSVTRSILLNLGVYQAAKAVLGLPLLISPTALFFVAIMTVMSSVIAFTGRFSNNSPQKGVSEDGTNRVVGTAHGMLSLSYAGAILAAGVAPTGLFNRTVFGVGHVLLGISLVLFMTGVQPSSKKSVNGFHNFIWKLFYAEYLLFPFL